MKRSLLFFSMIVLLTTSCNKEVRMEANGFTQGTTYSIIYFNQGKDYQYQIDSLLLAFDRTLSTYQKTSYISKWNSNQASSLNQPDLFKDVLRRAKEIHASTNGSFDITVAPLMSYWFERDWKMERLDSATVDSIMVFVGMDKIIEQNGVYIKMDPRVQLDVNAIAQGFSVDVISRFLESEGVFNYLVEIGGEVRSSGTKPNQETWKVGIDKPDYDNLDRELVLSVELIDKSLATSGNYRKFIEIDGQKLGHTLNPITGYPSTTDVLSATVITKDCMTADAYATGFVALGIDRSRKIIRSNDSVDAIFIYSDKSGNVNIWDSRKDQAASFGF